MASQPWAQVFFQWAAAGLIAAVPVRLSEELLHLGWELVLKGCSLESHIAHITTQIEKNINNNVDIEFLFGLT